MTNTISTGHYISLRRHAEQADLLAPLERPGVRGVQLRLPWVSLEPSMGHYELRQLEWWMALAANAGKKLVLMIEDKTFADDENPAPAYLHEHSLPNKRDGYTMARWRPEVVTRLRALADVIRAQNFAGFGGIAFQETATSLTAEAMAASGYTAERYEIALLALSWSCDFLYLNYIPGGQDRLERVIRESACAVGGPDLLPDNAKLNERVYPWFIDAPRRKSIFTSCQFDSLMDTTPDGKLRPLKELVAWGRDTLRASTIFWNVPWPGMPGHDMEAIFEEIARQPDL